MYTLLICDNLFNNINNNNIDFKYIVNNLAIACLYLGVSINDYNFTKLLTNDEIILCVKNILTILDYNLYFINPLNSLIDIFKLKKKDKEIYNYKYIYDISLIIINNYIKQKYTNINILIHKSFKEFNNLYK